MGGTNHIPKKEETFEERLIEQITRYLIENMRLSINVSKVASLFNISPSTLQRLFKKYLHHSFQHYLENLRISRARKLINEGWRIKEIMYEVGYKHRSTFNKAFLKKYHYPPSHFRR